MSCSLRNCEKEFKKSNKTYKMKIVSSLFLAVTISLLSAFTTAPASSEFPTVNVKTLDGKTVSTADYLAENSLTIVSFWASWCSPCKRELDAFGDFYEEWSEKGVGIVAITIDDARGLAKVPGIVASKNWDYQILSDSKQDLQRALNFQTIPQTFLVDSEGKIIYTHNGYNPGDEYELDDKILEALGE